MTQFDFERYSSAELSLLFYRSTPHKIKEFIAHLTPIQISLGITILQEKDLPKAAEKLLAALRGLTENTQLEALGKGLSANQFLYILNTISNKEIPSDKLSPLFVGLPPYVFFQVLTDISLDQLEILKHEGILEPLQHQLNLFVRDYELKNTEQLTHIESLNQEIKLLLPNELSYQSLDNIQKQIYQLQNHYENMLNAINKALAITWNTNRLDLIEKLNRLKEITHNQLVQLIGLPRAEGNGPSGLFSTLEALLFSIFEAPTNKERDLESLQDDDPSIEGLAKFSIWYLKDYWELGLLPFISHEGKLELSASKHTETERLEYRQALFNAVQQNLNKLGISTIRDLKKAQIFSKNMLKEYIAQHQMSLT